MLVIILIRFKYATYTSMWMSALVNIPGTFLHELMHYLVGLLMNAQPSAIYTVFPRRDMEGNYVMGSVGFRNVTFYNAVPASMAPLLLLPIGFCINRYVLPNMNPTFANYTLLCIIANNHRENAI